MSHTGSKCRKCKGTGSLLNDTCDLCEGSGIKLQSKVEEDYKNRAEMSGEIIFSDEENYIDLE